VLSVFFAFLSPRSFFASFLSVAMTLNRCLWALECPPGVVRGRGWAVKELVQAQKKFGGRHCSLAKLDPKYQSRSLARALGLLFHMKYTTPSPHRSETVSPPLAAAVFAGMRIGPPPRRPLPPPPVCPCPLAARVQHARRRCVAPHPPTYARAHLALYMAPNPEARRPQPQSRAQRTSLSCCTDQDTRDP
jgi:hypothetical protein